MILDTAVPVLFWQLLAVSMSRESDLRKGLDCELVAVLWDNEEEQQGRLFPEARTTPSKCFDRAA